MKPCQKPNQNYRRPAEMPAAKSPPSPPQEAAVHRYVHPIRTSRPAARSATEELLAGILETLDRHSEQLEEVLRRMNFSLLASISE